MTGVYWEEVNMKFVRLPHPSPAMIIAITALIIASAGTGYAVTNLPANSVGTLQLKKGAVTSAKVKDGSMSTIDFRKTSLKSLRGPRGLQGPKGAAGQPGVNSLVGIPCSVSSPVAYTGTTRPIYRAGVAVLACRSSQTAVVGDSIIEGNEECDDGNTLGGDGCSGTGLIERSTP